MMTSQIHKTVLEKCNYVLDGIVESSWHPFQDKGQCYMLYSVHIRLSVFFDEQKAQRTQEGAKPGKWSTMLNGGALDLFDGLDSGTALFLLENFRVIVCAILYRKSSEDNEGADSILL